MITRYIELSIAGLLIVKGIETFKIYKKGLLINIDRYIEKLLTTN